MSAIFCSLKKTVGSIRTHDYLYIRDFRHERGEYNLAHLTENPPENFVSELYFRALEIEQTQQP